MVWRANPDEIALLMQIWRGNRTDTWGQPAGTAQTTAVQPPTSQPMAIQPPTSRASVIPPRLQQEGKYGPEPYIPPARPSPTPVSPAQPAPLQPAQYDETLERLRRITANIVERYGDDDPRSRLAVDALHRYIQESGGKEAEEAPTSPPRPNFALRPGAYFRWALENEEVFPRVREKHPVINTILDWTADPIVAAANTLWESVSRPAFGLLPAAAKELGGEYADIWKRAQEFNNPQSYVGHKLFGAYEIPQSWAQKGHWFRTAFDIGTGVGGAAVTLLTAPFILAQFARQGVSPKEALEKGYSAWEELPQAYKTVSLFVDPLDVLGGAASKLPGALKAAKPAAHTLPYVSDISRLIPGSAVRSVGRFVRPITKVGEELLPMEKLGMKEHELSLLSPKSLVKLTPQSRALEAVYNALDMLSVEWADASSVDDMVSAVRRWADPEFIRSAAGERYRSLHGQRTHYLLKAVRQDAENILDEWAKTRGHLLTLENLAKERGVPLGEFIEIAKRGEAGKQAQAIAKSVDKAPKTHAEVVGKLYNDMAERLAEEAAKIYGVKGETVIRQLHSISKTLQSYLFIGSSPTYALKNITDNAFTTAVYGVGKLADADEIWKSLNIIPPVRSKAGIGGADIGKMAAGLSNLGDAIRRGMLKGTGGPASPQLARISAKLTTEGSPLTVMSDLASIMERMQGSSAYAVGAKRFFHKYWHSGKALPPLPKDLEEALRGSGLYEDVMRVVRSSTSTEDMLDALYGKRGLSFSEAVDKLVEAGDISDADAEMLRTLSAVSERLEKAADKVAEAHKVLTDPSLMEYYKRMHGIILDRDRAYMFTPQGKVSVGAVMGVMNDVSEKVFDAYLARDKVVNAYFTAPKELRGEWKEVRDAVRMLFEQVFQLNDQRIKNAMDALERAGYKGASTWFDASAIAAKRAEVWKLVEGIEDYGADLGSLEAKSWLWEDYFRFYDDAMRDVRRKYLTAIAEGYGAADDEVKGIIDELVELETAADRKYHDEILRQGWEKVKDAYRNGLPASRIDAIHMDMQNARNALYSDLRERRIELYRKFADAVNERAGISAPSPAGGAAYLMPEQPINFDDSIMQSYIQSILASALPKIAEEMQFGRRAKLSLAHAVSLGEETIGRLKKAGAPAGIPGLDSAMERRLMDWISRDVDAALKDTKIAAVKYGEFLRDRAMLNYDHRYGFQYYLDYIFPYQFWFTTSLGHWSRYFLTHPGRLGLLYRTEKMLHDLNEDPTLPERFRGMIRIEVPFMPEWASTLMIDPLWFTPFRQYTYGPVSLFGWSSEREELEKRLQEARERGESEDVIRELEALLEGAPTRDITDWATILASPTLPLQAASYLLNESKGAEDLPMLYSGGRWLKGITGLMGVRGGKGLDIEGTVRGAINRTLGTNLAEVDKYDVYRVQRAIAEMIEEGKVSPEDGERAIVSREGPVWDAAVRRVGVEMGVKSLLPMVRLGVYPKGEQELRLAQGLLGTIYSAEPPADTPEHKQWEQLLERFYRLFPGYGAKIMSSRPTGEQYRRYLSNRLWEKINSLSALERRLLMQSDVGPYYERFASGKADAGDMATLAKSLGIDADVLPKSVKPGEPPLPPFVEAGKRAPAYEEIDANLPKLTKEQRMAYDAFRKMVEAKYGDKLAQQQAELSQLSGSSEREAYIQNHPLLASYLSDRAQFYLRYPDIAKLLAGKPVEYTDLLRDVVIHELYAMGALRRKEMGQQYGLEKDVNLVLSGEAKPENVARVADALGISFDRRKLPKYVPPLKKPTVKATDEQVETYAKFREYILSKYGDKIYDLQNEYFAQDRSARPKYLKDHPELKEYWSDLDAFKKQHPDIAAIAWPTSPGAAGNVDAMIDLLRRVEQRVARRGYRPTRRGK